MDRGLFTLQKAPAVAGGIDRKWRKEGKKEKKGRERVWGVLLISPLHSLFYNELQLWLQIKTELFFSFFLSSPVIICSQVPGWRYDHNRAEGERTQPGRERRGGGWRQEKEEEEEERRASRGKGRMKFK